MALFRKKPPTDGDEGGPPEFAPQPEKARKWFEHGKTSADSFNFDYAILCFATGIRFDPADMAAHRSMYEAAVRYNNDGGKAASSKDVKNLDDGTPQGRFAAREFEWMKDLRNHKAALKTLEAAVKAEQNEYGRWIAPRVLNLVKGQKKQSKSVLLAAMELFREVEAWDQSLEVGEMARQLDPSDGDLANQMKNLSAQRAMDQGGYDSAAASEEGGFRKFIKDADKQQELIEEESLSGGGSTEERNLARAKEAYEATPELPEAINKYAQLLRKSGDPADDERAEAIYMKGFADVGEYRFRLAAGDVRISRLGRTLRALEEKAEAAPDDAQLAAERDTTRKALLELKSTEYTERVGKYPTDRLRKYQLGEVLFELGDYDEAMAQLQKSKDEPKLRSRAGHMLGKCFFAEGWHSDAIAELKDALAATDATEKDREQSIRYDLMLALIEAAREERDSDLAKEAKQICSDIARRDITYRDIRAKRKEVEALGKDLDGDG